jgi:RNA polymerase sigma-70 factor (ECF subfamily)
MPIDLEDIFRSHEREVFAYFLRLLGDRHDAEELAQETFVRACSASLRFRGDSSVRTWLFGIARRVFLETIRARGVERPAELEDRPADRPPEVIEDRLDLARALASLALIDREALVMVDMLSFTPQEAAALLGIGPEAFRVRLHRARRRLREAYAR